MSANPASLFAATSILLYLLSAGLYWRAEAFRPWSQLTAVIAIACHGISLVLVLGQFEAFEFGFGPALSLFAWQCALFVLLASFTRPLHHLGLVVYPTAAAAVTTLWFLPTTSPGEAFTGGVPLAAHILLSLLAYGLLTIAAVQALTLLLQDRGLRQHHIPPWLQRLPALETMEQLLFQIITLGFLLLSLSLFSGLLFLDDLFAQHLVHKTVLSFVAWLIFAILIWGRWQFGWRGRKAIHWTLGGYSGLILAYFGSKWVLEVILNQRWG
ncbi:MAG: cytochrome c biogenesis protein CcsA [Salinisphaeraceae bacterium]|nr:cytochrome c biogenesis protein CcsA [Salinisphaeraceae bacterium]